MRLALPGIVPIEVWDVVVGGRMLQAWRAESAFAARVGEMVASIREAPPPAWSARARALARSIERVHLGGGGADDAIVAAIASRAIPCTRTADPFAAARAAARLSPTPPTSIPTTGLGVDVGQTGIKLATAERAWRVERDFARAPFRDEVPRGDRDRARASTIGWISDVLRTAGPTERAVIGLPCELDDAGHPRSCSYAWYDPDRELRAELARAARISSLAIANDAELAAVAARAELASSSITLVLTIGFGVGGALLT